MSQYHFITQLKFLHIQKSMIQIPLLFLLLLQRNNAVGAKGFSLTNSGERKYLLNDQSKVICRFNTKEYVPGDVWYPTSKTSLKADYCVRCMCLTTGRLNCSTELCPTNCDRYPDQPCCKTCNTNSETIIHSDELSANNNGETSNNRNLEASGSTEDAEEDEDSNSEYVSCLHQGKVYKDGDTFAANVSGLPIASTEKGSCMQCECQNGMVLCAMKSCSSFKCALRSNPDAEDPCCNRCEEWKSSGINKPGSDVVGNARLPSRGRGGNPTHQQRSSTFFGSSQRGGMNGGMLDSTGSSNSGDFNFKAFSGGLTSLTEDSSVTFKDVNGAGNARKPTDDCVSSGQFYLHGSSWHPIIGPFGSMECVTCQCNHGQIECGRLKCTPKRELACSKPVKVEGHCCPVCQNEKAFSDGFSMCAPLKQDINAYKAIGIGLNGTEYIEFAFVPTTKTGRIIGSHPEAQPQVETHEWKLVNYNIEEFTTHYLTEAQFDEIKIQKSFVLLGATSQSMPTIIAKNVEKFTRREKKLEKRCTMRCNIRISSLERSLRLHKLISRSQCLVHERTVMTT